MIMDEETLKFMDNMGIVEEGAIVSEEDLEIPLSDLRKEDTNAGYRTR